MAGNAILQENPDAIELVKGMDIGKPSLRMFYALESHQLKASIDAILDEITNEGVMKKLLIKHNLKF